MKIVLCGSMHFAKEMNDTKTELEKMNHEVVLPGDIDECLENPGLKTSFENDLESELNHCLAQDLLMEGFEKISNSEATLFVNYPKNGIKGYIGASGLMELAVAFFLRKKIFLLYPIDRTQKCALEVELTKPIILNGDLNRIKLCQTN